MTKSYKEMEFHELKALLTGEALMQIGSGYKFQEVMHYVMNQTLIWASEREKE